jgi:hypothetical protein
MPANLARDSSESNCLIKPISGSIPVIKVG